MTDLEFDVLDELYFVTSFQELAQTLELEESKLCGVLFGLLKKDWIKCYVDPSDEVLSQNLDFDQHYQSYYYLATKTGLMAHNGK